MAFWFYLMMAGSDGGSGGSGQFIVVGANGNLATSANGTSWTAQTSGFGSTNIEDVAVGAGLVAIAGDSGKLATASTSNLTTWTLRTSGFGTTGINDIRFSNSLWVASGGSGKLATATNPTGTWTLNASSGLPSDSLRDLRAIGSSWGLVSQGNSIWSTTNPAGTWTNVGSPSGSGNVLALGAGTLWVALLNSGALYSASTLSGPWTLRANLGMINPSAEFTEFSYANGIYFLSYALGPSHPRLYVSSNGTTWTSGTHPAMGVTGAGQYKFAYSSGLYVAVGPGGFLWTSPDYVNWTEQTSGFGSNSIRGIAVV
jgi:hypothetical protein